MEEAPQENPIDDPLANRVADILKASVPWLLALEVVNASIYFFYMSKLSGDLFSTIIGAVVGFAFGNVMASKFPSRREP